MEKFEDITGKTIANVTVENEDEVMRFVFTDGTAAMLYHEQDCCEFVRLYEIAGSLEDIVGTPILKAEESVSDNVAPDEVNHDGGYDDSFMWTFYHIVTVKGYATLRWLGESNGYYSEYVSFKEITA